MRQARKLVDPEKAVQTSLILDEPDFDRIYFQTAAGALHGLWCPDLTPGKAEAHGDSKILLQSGRQRTSEGSLPLYKDARGILKVSAPSVVPREKRRR